MVRIHLRERRSTTRPCEGAEVERQGSTAAFYKLRRFMWDTDSAYSHITQPLRKLLGKNVPFEWGPEQQSSYNEIISALESAGALYPYNPSLEITHVADAQPTGIASSVYMVTEDGEEKWWPLDHIRRSLTPTESGYPQIDRESLAQSWGMRQQRYYLLGRNSKHIATINHCFHYTMQQNEQHHEWKNIS